MRDLPPTVRTLGHPVIAGALTILLGGTGLTLAITKAESGGLWLGLVLVLPLAWITRAAQAVRQQRQLKQAWASMAPAQPARRLPWKPVVGFGVLATLAIANGGMTPAEITLGLLGVSVLAVGLLLKRRNGAVPQRRPAKKREHPPVAVLVRRPVMPVPSLTAAYSALPAHCWAVLGKHR